MDQFWYRAVHTLPLLAVLILPANCDRVAVDLSRLPCESGACVEGYVCHPQQDMCVPAIEVGCTKRESVCPTTVSTGDGCVAEGSFVPCVKGVADCAAGCRTCEEGAWSECTGPGCILGEPQTCGSCDDDCTAKIQNAGAACNSAGAAATCDYVGACDHGFGDADGDRQNGCECQKSNDGRELTCNGVDEDCDGTDFQESGTVDNCSGCGDRCADKIANAARLTCTNGVCGYASCAQGFGDKDGDASNGCECTQSNNGVESCDGNDTDCDGVVDNLSAAELQRDCSAQMPLAKAVNAWTCVSGSCAVGICSTDSYNTDSDPSTGCNYSCTPATPGPEVCDGEDNDCDGVVNNAADINTDCDVELGSPPDVAQWACVNHACQIQTCAPGQADGDEDPSTGCELACTISNSAVEFCDGRDNDCNGFTDDGLGASCQCDSGTPSTEVCDSIDNDCNDAIDEGLSAICQCTGGATASSEVCDGIDNDCNDAVDDGLGGVCQCDEGVASNEVCDGIDNDCNESIDDGFAGTCQCAGGAAPLASEACNGVDDDCNDAIGDGLTGCQCTGGTAPSAEICDAIDNDCNGATDEGVANCACSMGPPSAEACSGNGIDDDCDDEIDTDCPATCVAVTGPGNVTAPGTAALTIELQEADSDPFTYAAAAISCAAPRQTLDGPADFTGDNAGSWSAAAGSVSFQDWPNSFPSPSCGSVGSGGRFRRLSLDTTAYLQLGGPIEVTGFEDLEMTLVAGYRSNPPAGVNMKVYFCCAAAVTCDPDPAQDGAWFATILNEADDAGGPDNDECHIETLPIPAPIDCGRLMLRIEWIENIGADPRAGVDDISVTGDVVFAPITDAGTGVYDTSIQSAISGLGIDVTCTWDDGVGPQSSCAIETVNY